jgi:hypothetical protein
VAAAFAVPAFASGQVFEWTGASGGAGWSNPANWNPGLPTSGPTTTLTFNNAAVPTMTMDIAGGLSLNRLEFGAASVVRTLSGTQPLIFTGTTPSIDYRHAAGAAGQISVGVPVQLQQTLTLTGQIDFTRQFIFNSASSLTGSGGIILESGVFATNSTTNNFTGPVVLRGGLWGGNVNATFGQSTSVTVEPGGAIQLFGTSSITVNRPLSLAGTGSPEVGGYALAASGGGTKTWSGPTTLAGNATVRSFGTTATSLQLTGTVDLAGHTLTATPTAGNLVRITGVVSGAGGVILNAFADAQGLFLTGTAPNTFTGTVRSNVGTLAIRDDGQLGAAENLVRLTNGGTLSTAGLAGFGGIVELPATRLIELDTGGRLAVQGNEELHVRGVISGTGPLRIGRSGFGVRLFAENTFTGNVEIEQLGTLYIQNDAALGPVSNDIVMLGTTTGGSLVLDGPGMTLSAERTVSVAAGLRGNLGSIGNHTVASTLTGEGRIAVFGTGVLTLTGDNTVAELEVFQTTSVLGVRKDSALGAPDGKLILSGATLLATDSFTIPATRSILTQFTSGSTRIDTNGHTLVIDSVIGVDPAQGGQGAIISKHGTGTLVLNGVNTVEREMVLSAGALMGDGSVRTLRTEGNSLISPGQPNAAGLFTVEANLSVGVLTTLLFELGGAGRGIGYDALNVGGQLLRSGIVEVELLGSFMPTAGNSFDLIDFSSVSGTFSQLRLPELPLGLEWDTSAFAATGVISVIPEPGSALGLLAAPMLLLRRRR